MGNLLDKIKIIHVAAAVAAGASIDNNSTRIDMQGYDGVAFFTTITDSVDTGVAALTIEQNDADSDAGMAALSGGVATLTSAADDDLNDKTLVVDVFRPRERYVQAVRTSATANIAYGTCYAVLYKGRKLPATQHADTTVTKVVSPAEA